MTQSKRNWCFSVVKTILGMCSEVSSGVSFTHSVHATPEVAKAICGFCQGFALVQYEEILCGVHTGGGARGFRLTVTPR